MNINGDVMRKLLAALSLCLVATDLLSQGISGKAGIAHVANSDATASTASGSSITLLMRTSLAAGQSIVLCVFSGNRRDVTFTVTDNGPVAGSNIYTTDRSQNLATKGGTIAVLHADNISIAGHNRTKTGTPLCRRNLANRQLASTCKVLGLERIGWHSFRHSNATLLDSVGTPRGTVSAILGHSSSEITEIYVHSLPSGAREAVEKVEALLIGPNRTQIEEIQNLATPVIQ
jgi:hypothetical protein